MLKENILRILDERKMNPSELERRAMLAPSTIRKILLSKSPNPTLKTLLSISRVLGCSIDSLVGRERKE